MRAKEKGRPPQPTLLQPGFKVTKKPRYCKSEAVRELEALADSDARRRYPTVPYLAPRTFRDDSANGLTKCIIQFLRLSGYQAERVSSTGRPIDRRQTFTDVLGRRRQIGSMKWIPGTGTNGTSDISATIAGRSVKIEVKINDRQSEVQRRYQADIEAAGGMYSIARSFQEFYDWYNQNFKK